MANLSVKLDETTRQRLQQAAAIQGQTPHALMVSAIGNELDRIESENRFVQRALKARHAVIEGCAVLDGDAFANYLKARVRGQAAKRPDAKPLEVHLSKAA